MFLKKNNVYANLCTIKRRKKTTSPRVSTCVSTELVQIRSRKFSDVIDIFALKIACT